MGLESLRFDKTKITELVLSYKIGLILIFGSYARDDVQKRNDLDIGIYLNEMINPQDLWELQTRLMELFQRDDIDIVVLNDTSPFLLFNVLKHHIPLYISSEQLFDQFKTIAMKRYWQYNAHFKKFADIVKEKRLRRLGIVNGR
jgi:predicted nucleotidyltransferase